MLIDTAASEEPMIWLLAALAAGASQVLCANLNRSTRDEWITAERATPVL
jgi:hypothetical protein